MVLVLQRNSSNSPETKPTHQPKTMTHETKTKLKAALATGYIVLSACLGLAFFGRFIIAIITN